MNFLFNLGCLARTSSRSTEYEIVGGAIAFFVILLLVFYAITVVCYWKLFKKAGLNGWEAIIPFYNGYCLYKIAFGNAVLFWVTLGLAFVSWIPFVGVLAGLAVFVISIIQIVNLSKAFGHGGGFAVGLIFLPMIFLLILAFGDSKYCGPLSEYNSFNNSLPNSIFDNNNYNNNQNFNPNNNFNNNQNFNANNNFNNNPNFNVNNNFNGNVNNQNFNPNNNFNNNFNNNGNGFNNNGNNTGNNFNNTGFNNSGNNGNNAGNNFNNGSFNGNNSFNNNNFNGNNGNNGNMFR